MTNEEAKYINEMAFLVDAFGDTDCHLISAQELAISALEKQIPMKPIRIPDRIGENWCKCPTCETAFEWGGRSHRDHQYCGRCGQAIDWSKEVEV